MKAIKIEPAHLLTLYSQDGLALGLLQRVAPPSQYGIAGSALIPQTCPAIEAIREARNTLGSDGILYVVDPEGLWDPAWGELDQRLLIAPTSMASAPNR